MKFSFIALRAVLLLSLFCILQPTSSVAATSPAKVGTVSELLLLLLLFPLAQALFQRFKGD